VAPSFGLGRVSETVATRQDCPKDYKEVTRAGGSLIMISGAVRRSLGVAAATDERVAALIFHLHSPNVEGAPFFALLREVEESAF